LSAAARQAAGLVELVRQLTAHAIDELLIGSEGGMVHTCSSWASMAKGFTEFRMQFSWGIAHDRQAAALQRAIRTKGCNNDMASRFDSAQNLTNIGRSFFYGCQEMKYRTVVLQVHAVRREVCRGDVGHRPLNPLRRWAEATLTFRQCGR